LHAAVRFGLSLNLKSGANVGKNAGNMPENAAEKDRKIAVLPEF
jgi:hypothetical protein